MTALAALLIAAAPASAAGLYQAHQMEVGAALELRKDGRFRYQLDYGAVSEEAAGTWTFDGKVVRLTSNPMPKAPGFELVRDDPAPKGELVMVVEPPGFGDEGYRLDAIGVDSDSGEKGLVSADEQGKVDSGPHRLASVDPLVPVYGNVGGHFRSARTGATTSCFASIPTTLAMPGSTRSRSSSLRAVSSSLATTRRFALFEFGPKKASGE